MATLNTPAKLSKWPVHSRHIALAKRRKDETKIPIVATLDQALDYAFANSCDWMPESRGDDNQ